MFLYQYTFTGEPQRLMAVWDGVISEIGKEAFFLNIVTATSEGITVLDVCPTEADFAGWIEGDAWKHVKSQFGGPEPVVTALGRIHSAIALPSIVEAIPVSTHAH